MMDEEMIGTTQIEGNSSGQVVVFQLGDEEFGIDIQRVKEIVRLLPVTAVPQAPFYIEGLANLRGGILPIADLRARFALPPVERTEATRVVVADVGGTLTGFIVDKVSEVMAVPPGAIEPPPTIAIGVAAEYLSGVAKLDQGRRLLMMLDVNRILDVSELAEVATEGHHLVDEQDEQQRDTQAQAREEEQLVSFRLEGEEYAIPIEVMQEVIRLPEVTHVPQAPDYILGVVALRDRLLPVIDLRLRFGLPTQETDDATRVVVVNLNGMVAGLVVDSISEVLRLPKEDIEPPPPIVQGAAAEQLRGMGKLDEGRRLIILLEATKLFSAEEQNMLAQLDERVEEEAGAETGGPIRAAVGGQAKAALGDEEQLVSFNLGDEDFGVDINQVQEIVRLSAITRVPQAPGYMEGVLNLRGNVLPVVNLRTRLGLPPVDHTEASRIVVLDIGGAKTGAIVDRVTGVLRMKKGDIEPPPPIVGGVGAAFVQGVGKQGGSDQMVVLLKASEVAV